MASYLSLLTTTKPAGEQLRAICLYRLNLKVNEYVKNNHFEQAENLLKTAYKSKVTQALIDWGAGHRVILSSSKKELTETLEKLRSLSEKTAGLNEKNKNAAIADVKRHYAKLSAMDIDAINNDDELNDTALQEFKRNCETGSPIETLLKKYIVMFRLNALQAAVNAALAESAKAFVEAEAKDLSDARELAEKNKLEQIAQKKKQAEEAAREAIKDQATRTEFNEAVACVKKHLDHLDLSNVMQKQYLLSLIEKYSMWQKDGTDFLGVKANRLLTSPFQSAVDQCMKNMEACEKEYDELFRQSVKESGAWRDTPHEGEIYNSIRCMVANLRKKFVDYLDLNYVHNGKFLSTIHSEMTKLSEDLLKVSGLGFTLMEASDLCFGVAFKFRWCEDINVMPHTEKWLQAYMVAFLEEFIPKVRGKGPQISESCKILKSANAIGRKLKGKIKPEMFKEWISYLNVYNVKFYIKNIDLAEEITKLHQAIENELLDYTKHDSFDALIKIANILGHCGNWRLPLKGPVLETNGMFLALDVPLHKKFIDAMDKFAGLDEEKKNSIFGYEIKIGAIVAFLDVWHNLTSRGLLGYVSPADRKTIEAAGRKEVAKAARLVIAEVARAKSIESVDRESIAKILKCHTVLRKALT